MPGLLAELSASCRARWTPIVVGSVLLISLLSSVNDHVRPFVQTVTDGQDTQKRAEGRH